MSDIIKFLQIIMTGKLQEMVSYELVSNFQLRSLSWWARSHYRKDFFQMVNRVLFEKVI